MAGVNRSLRVAGHVMACWTVVGCSSVPNDVVVPPSCEYPESLGGGGVEGECGVTPGAWYPLGDSDLIEWPARAHWASAGGGGVTRRTVHPWRDKVRTALDSAGNVAIGFLRLEELEIQVEIHMWTSSGWRALPSDFEPSSEFNDLRDFDLAFGANDELFLAERRAARVVVWEWDGVTWQPRGEWDAAGSPETAGLTAGWYRAVAIAVDGESRASVIWRQGENLLLRRWDGSQWAGLGGSDLPAGLTASTVTALEPSIALTSAGEPVVAWIDGVSNQWLDQGDAVYVRRWSGTAWEALGISGTGSGLAVSAVAAREPVSIEVGSGDQVFVSWTDLAGNFVMRVWTGASWSDAESLTPGPGTDGDAILALGPGGSSPYVAWREDDRFAVHRRLAPATWQGILNPRESGAWYPGIAAFDVVVDSADRFGFSWLPSVGANQASLHSLYHLRFDGAGWDELGQATSSGDGLGPGARSVVRVASDGRTVVGYQVWSADGCAVRVQLWDGATWQALGSLTELDAPGWCRIDDMVFTPAGHILALVIRSDPDIDPESPEGPQEAVVVEWDGSAWTRMGERVDWAGDWITGAGIILGDDDRPLVAYLAGIQESGSFRVRAWSGTEWVPLGDRALPFTVDSLAGTSFILDAQGRPVLTSISTWDASPRRYVSRWDGATWEDLSGEAWAPAELQEQQRLVVDCQGRLVLAWLRDADIRLHRLEADSWNEVPATADELACIPEVARIAVHARDVTDQFEVYLRRFSDGEWSGLSASNDGAGLSASSAPSIFPTFDVGAGRACVTWQEPGADTRPNILLRCHDLPP